MMVNYKEGATNGFDRLYDGNSFTTNEIDIYSVLDNHNLVIQGRGLPFDVNFFLDSTSFKTQIKADGSHART